MYTLVSQAEILVRISNYLSSGKSIFNLAASYNESEATSKLSAVKLVEVLSINSATLFYKSLPLLNFVWISTNKKGST